MRAAANIKLWPNSQLNDVCLIKSATVDLVQRRGQTHLCADQTTEHAGHFIEIRTYTFTPLISVSYLLLLTTSISRRGMQTDLDLL